MEEKQADIDYIIKSRVNDAISVQYQEKVDAAGKPVAADMEQQQKGRRTAIEQERSAFLKSDPYAQAVFYEQFAAKVEQQTKAAQSAVLAGFIGTQIGQQIIAAIADAEIGAKIGQDFVNQAKNSHLEDKFIKAKEKLTDLSEDELKKQSQSDTYLRAIRVSQESKFAEMMSRVQKEEAESAADTIFVKKAIMGNGTPSTAMDSLAETLIKAMNKLDESGRGAFGAAAISNLAHAIDTGKVTEGHKIATYGVLKNLVEQANFDDAGNALAKDINRLDSGQVTGAEAARITSMKKLFGPGGMFDIGLKREKIKVLRKNNNGDILNNVDDVICTAKKWENYSHQEQAIMTYRIGEEKEGVVQYKGSDKTVGTLQNWILSGGDNKLIKTHLGIAAYMNEHDIADYSKAAKEWFKNAKKDDQTILHSVDEMKKAYGRIQTQLLEGAEGFKKDAFNTNHTENGGHQSSDQSWGGVRFSTVDESRSIIEANYRKRPGGHKTNYHSIGVLNSGTGVLEEINAKMFRAAFTGVKRVQDIAGLLDRTRDGMLAYAPSEGYDRYIMTDQEKLTMEAEISSEIVKMGNSFTNLDSKKQKKATEKIRARLMKKQKEGAGYVGGKDLDKIKDRFGGVVGMLGRVVIPQIYGAMEAFNLASWKAFGGASAQAADLGAHNLVIAGEKPEDEIHSRHMADLIGGILKKYESNMEDFAAILREQGINVENGETMKKELEARLQTALEQQRELISRKLDEKSDEASEDEEPAES